MLVEDNDNCSDGGDDNLPLLEPIVASVSEASPVAVTPQGTSPTDKDDIAQSPQHQLWVQHILRSEPLPAPTDPADAPLVHAIHMLQQRVVLAADETSTAVADATETRRRWAAQQAHVEAQSKRMAALEEQVQALQQRNERLVVERRVLKKAYTNLVQHSTVSLERYVEQALLQHEEQLVVGRCRTDDSATTVSDEEQDHDFEELEPLPAEVMASSDAEEEELDADTAWIPTALAVPYTPVRIVPREDTNHKTTTSSGKRRRQPMLSLEKPKVVVERSGTPTTTSSDTVTAAAAAALSPQNNNSCSSTPPVASGDPLMFRSLAIPMS